MKTDTLIEQLAEQSKPIKPMANPAYMAFLWMFISVIYVAGLAFYLGVRDDLAIKSGEAVFNIEIILSVAASISGFIAASWLSVPDSYQQPWVKIIPVIFFTALSSLLAYQLFASGIDYIAAFEAINLTYKCALDMLTFSIFPFFVMLYFISKAATTQYYWMGISAGIAALCLSYTVLRIVEPNDMPQHIVFWHYLPMIAMLFIAMYLAKKILKW